MKTNKIIIKDVTGDNAGLIWELSREGFPEGTVVRNFTYRESNNSVIFGNGRCVAWVGETCEFI